MTGFSSKCYSSWYGLWRLGLALPAVFCLLSLESRSINWYFSWTKKPGGVQLPQSYDRIDCQFVSPSLISPFIIFIFFIRTWKSHLDPSPSSVDAWYWKVTCNLSIDRNFSKLNKSKLLSVFYCLLPNYLASLSQERDLLLNRESYTTGFPSNKLTQE